MHHGHHHRHHRHDRRFARGERGPDFHRAGGHHRHGGRASLGRFFAHGDLRLVILHLIAEKPRHGYEIIKAIEERVGGAYSPSPGVIYPTLTLLEELGYVTAAATEGSRKLHAVTPEGQAFLEANRPTLDALHARMDEARQEAADPGPQVVRALENLKLALRLRLSRGKLDPAQADALAALLDATAQGVERI